MLVDSKTWKETWDTLEDLDGGGQGAVKKVKHKRSGIVGFLKILNKQKDDERRARFYREATAYDSSSNINIPKLLESNAHHYSDHEYKVYIVTEFVAGPTLTQYIEENGARDIYESSGIIFELLDILKYCHDNGWVHRDIKPDNIILNEDLVPKLLDFGMSFKDGITPDFGTELGQEVGNRFLRLPELRIDSPVKQDVRSDLSFLGGIYFYLLTSIAPVSLKDEEGRMPHQRSIPVSLIKDKAPNSFMELLAFFDKSFSEKISDRFISAEDMKTKLMKQINYEENPNVSNVEQDLEVVLKSINTKANLELAENKKTYDMAMSIINSVHKDLGVLFRPVYNSFQTGYVNSSEGLKNTLGFGHFANQDLRFSPTFLIKAIGEEIVIHVDNEVIYRTDINAPELTQEFRDIIREVYITGMRQLVEK